MADRDWGRPKIIVKNARRGSSWNSDVIDVGAYNGCAIEVIVSDAVVAADAVTCETGTSEVQTLTFEAKADMDDGEFIVIEDGNGASWAVAADLTGSSAEPTATLWGDIPAANKAQVDLSSATDEASVAAAFELALDALTGFSAVVTTDDAAADGTMELTHLVPGDIALATSHLEDDSGVGGISCSEDTAGIAGDVSVSLDTLAIANHGLPTGAAVQVAIGSGSLPTGLSAGTTYYVIAVDENTIKLATTLVNAEAGTAINITGYGTLGAETITVTPDALAIAVKPQVSVSGSNFEDVGSSVNMSFTDNGFDVVSISSLECPYLRLNFTVTSGVGDVEAIMFAKQ